MGEPVGSVKAVGWEGGDTPLEEFTRLTRYVMARTDYSQAIKALQTTTTSETTTAPSTYHRHTLRL